MSINIRNTIICHLIIRLEQSTLVSSGAVHDTSYNNTAPIIPLQSSSQLLGFVIVSVHVNCQSCIN